MRQSQNKNRMRGRSRKPSNSINRNFESNGPDVKIRGNAAHIAEKYATLARDALSAGDHVMAENYLQHAEHYNRIILAANAQQSVRDDSGAGRGQQPSAGDDEDDEIEMNSRADDSGRGQDRGQDRDAEDGGGERSNGSRRPRRRDARGQARDEGSDDRQDNEAAASAEPAGQANGDGEVAAAGNGKPRRPSRQKAAKAELPEGVSRDAAALPESLLGGAMRESASVED